ncbi:NHL repeat containing protein [Neobacillus bataviensis LMG 21833]|uniref:NHL repeat containing protein n=1 Tax=Neobacillus bataviensis LMG 21833 TaxID=1117379 RepID=K6DWH2_9BACI|nr:NHL repeat-containing protein [Neobacillus bataviensis]EKN65206.1 NHL repeat containing protein [Neobacillus bataviensis LMG 21833]
MFRTLLKYTAVLLLVIYVSSVFSQSASADAPYDSYTYNFWLEPVKSPSPYLPVSEMNGQALGVGELKEPSDLFVTKDGTIYVVDTKNNRIVYFNEKMEPLGEITSFHHGDSLNQPQGIFVTSENHKFVADTENQRIVEFDQENRFVRSIVRPETNLLTDKTGFRPTKVAVDGAGRIFAIAIGVNSGIIELNPDGTFQGFMGASEVSVDPLKYIWTKYFASEEQIKRMKLIIPTEYNNLFLDENEFLYVTLGNISKEERGKDVIRRLNPSGVNVLRDFGYGSPIGDYYISNSNKFTQFRDISVTDYHVYSALDGTDGKIFTYDYDGNLLYVFGGNGNRLGNFLNPVALGQYDDQLFVLDNKKNAIITFELTAYGKTVNAAIKAHNDGDYQGSAKKWKEVLALNANADLAYTGLGKVYLRNDENKRAMEYFKLADNRKYYSKAFSDYRREYLNEHFGRIMTSVLSALIIMIFVRLVLTSQWFTRRGRKEAENESLS